jgi:hypothetical protein
MIGAGVLLHRATGDTGYMAHATVTATAVIRRFSIPMLVKQDAAFNAVLFRNLFLLDQVTPDLAYRNLALAYSDEMWNKFRNPRTGLFRGGKSSLNNSAPMVEIYALLAGASPRA